jgi:hypothetical protein
MVALDQGGAVAARVFAVHAVDPRRCHPIDGQRGQAQFGVAEGAGCHAPWSVGFLWPADPISIGFAEGLAPSDAQWGFCTEFSLYPVGDDVAVFAATGGRYRQKSLNRAVLNCV